MVRRASTRLVKRRTEWSGELWLDWFDTLNLHVHKRERKLRWWVFGIGGSMHRRQYADSSSVVRTSPTEVQCTSRQEYAGVRFMHQALRRTIGLTGSALLVWRWARPNPPLLSTTTEVSWEVIAPKGGTKGPLSPAFDLFSTFMSFPFFLSARYLRSMGEGVIVEPGTGEQPQRPVRLEMGQSSSGVYTAGTNWCFVVMTLHGVKVSPQSGGSGPKTPVFKKNKNGVLHNDVLCPLIYGCQDDFILGHL
ncbi:hypothetical protein KSP39_PZI002400 [Platanthera zijinensis]|uniref:Uncharacterized protein n=1 Tax=Platanthera zijinensis TaxID=2320716 RepID=A0AAP0BYA1_9ASPA